MVNIVVLLIVMAMGMMVMVMVMMMMMMFVLILFGGIQWVQLKMTTAIGVIVVYMVFAFMCFANVFPFFFISIYLSMFSYLNLSFNVNLNIYHLKVMLFASLSAGVLRLYTTTALKLKLLR